MHTTSVVISHRVTEFNGQNVTPSILKDVCTEGKILAANLNVCTEVAGISQSV
jgi:hypothetical protein